MNSYKNNNILDYEIYFNEAGSCQMEGIISLYNYINGFLVSILFIVTTSLFVIISTHISAERHIKQIKEEEDLIELVNWMRFLQKWTHSTNLELIWTVIPTIILLAIAVPSFILLYSLDEIVDTQCVVRIVAYQWYWKYEYPALDSSLEDVISLSYLSYMLPIDDLTEENNLRLLEVDSPLILPINVNSKLIITSKDVIHSFAIPSLGIKMDAVPGRLNQVTAHVFKPGVYYGQCSELCGVNHAFMPIVINAVHFSTFDSFLFHGSTNSTFIAPSFPSEYSSSLEEEATSLERAAIIDCLTHFFNDDEYRAILYFLEAYLNYVKAANKLQIQNTYLALYDVVIQRNEIFMKALSLAELYQRCCNTVNNCEGPICYEFSERTKILKSKVLEIYLLERENMHAVCDIVKAEASVGHFGGLVRQAISNPFVDYAVLPEIRNPKTMWGAPTFLGYPYPEESIFNGKYLNFGTKHFHPSDFESSDVKSLLFDMDNVEKFLNINYNVQVQSHYFIYRTLMQIEYAAHTGEAGYTDEDAAQAAIIETCLSSNFVFFYLPIFLFENSEQEIEYYTSKINELKDLFIPFYDGEQKPIKDADEIFLFTSEDIKPLIAKYYPIFVSFLDKYTIGEELFLTVQFLDFLGDLFHLECEQKIAAEENAWIAAEENAWIAAEQKIAAEENAWIAAEIELANSRKVIEDIMSRP